MEVLSQEPRAKVYVLLKTSKSPANIFRRVAGQRIKVDEKPISHAYGKITFFDKKINKNRTIRLKLNCDSIDLQEQIKAHNIPANEKFTQDERDALKFRWGQLVTDNPLVQSYLETSPEFAGRWGDKPEVQCNSVKRPKYMLLDEESELEVEDKLYKLRIEAGKLIADIDDLDTAQQLLIRLNGSYFQTPNELKRCRRLLIEYLDAADEAMLLNILKKDKDVNIDEQIRVMVGRAINFKIISFDQVEGQVVELDKNGKHKELKQISSEHSPETRLDMFVEFLGSEDGKPLRQHLEKKVKGRK